MSGVDRRTLLRGACVGCAGLVLAACGGSSGTSTASGDGAGASPTQGDSSPAASPAGDHPLATLADMKIGTAVAAKTADGTNLLMTRTSDTSVVAFNATCTHQGCTVEPNGAKLTCPCHGSVYDAKTGQVMRGPAPAPLRSVPVVVKAGEVVLA